MPMLFWLPLIYLTAFLEILAEPKSATGIKTRRQ
jgi:hypothetical protein